MTMAQMQRPKEVTGVNTWEAIMPNPTVSKVQSEIFVKKLVALGVSNLTYIRALFPEDAYVNKQLEGIRLKILRDDGSCGAATKLISWLKGAFDAFTKKYLRQLTVAIHLDGAGQDDALETYSFYFNYKGNNLSSCNIQRENKTEDTVSSNVSCSLQEVRQTTLEMLRTTIHLTQSLPALPDKCAISVKLLYFEDITPRDYEPPGFFSVETSSFNFPSKTINLKIGEVHTPFHGLKFNAKLQETLFPDKQKSNASYKTPNIQDDEQSTIRSERDSTLNETTMSEDVIENSLTDDILINRSIRQPDEALSAPSASPAQPFSGIAVSNAELTRTPTEVRQQGVFCACGVEKDGGLMVKCMFCNKWQHAACYGLLTEADIPPIHVCEGCHNSKEEQRQCTDIKLLSLSIQQRKEICLYRRTLRCVALDTSRVSPQLISQDLDVSKEISQLLFELLDNDGVLRKSKGSSRSVCMKVLKEDVLPCYFGSNANLSLHEYVLKLEEPMIGDLKKITITGTRRVSTRNKRKRNGCIIEEDDPVINKKQKTSRGED